MQPEKKKERVRNSVCFIWEHSNNSETQRHSNNWGLYPPLNRREGSSRDLGLQMGGREPTGRWEEKILGRFLRVHWMARRSNQFILKEIHPECWLEGQMLKLKLQYFGQLVGKHPASGKDWGQKDRGEIEDERIRWQLRLNESEFEQTVGDSEGQKSLACCSSWGHKELDTTEWPNDNKNNKKQVLGKQMFATPELFRNKKLSLVIALFLV